MLIYIIDIVSLGTVYFTLYHSNGFDFVLCAVPVILREKQKSLKGRWYNLGFTCIGMLIGSLYAIVAEPTTLNKTFPISSPVIWFVIGIAMLAGIQFIKYMGTKSDKKV